MRVFPLTAARPALALLAAAPALAFLAAAPATVFLAAAPAAAADRCAAAADQTAMTACYEKALKTADAALNASYREIEGRLADDPATKKRLVGAQKAWLAFRDAECRFSTSAVEGGSMAPTLTAICLQEMTAARTSELKGYLACEEGDLSCPVPPGR